jgi:hypothetical protein
MLPEGRNIPGEKCKTSNNDEVFLFTLYQIEQIETISTYTTTFPVHFAAFRAVLFSEEKHLDVQELPCSDYALQYLF